MTKTPETAKAEMLIGEPSEIDVHAEAIFWFWLVGLFMLEICAWLL